MKVIDEKRKTNVDRKKRMKLRDPAIRKPPTTLSPTPPPPPKFKRTKKLRLIMSDRSPPPKVCRRRSPSPLSSRSPSPLPRSASPLLSRSPTPQPQPPPLDRPVRRVTPLCKVKKPLVTKGNQTKKVLGFSSYSQSSNPLQHFSGIQPLVPPQVSPIEHVPQQTHSQQQSNPSPSAPTPQQPLPPLPSASQHNIGSRGISNCSASFCPTTHPSASQTNHIPVPPSNLMSAQSEANLGLSSNSGAANENARSIRLAEDKPDRKTRGVVNGVTVAAVKAAMNGKIKVEKAANTDTPAYPNVKSWLVHEIGSCIRDKVTMKSALFSELLPGVEDVLYAHLSPNFVIECQDDWLWSYILKRANKIYINWKSTCKSHWEAYGDELPREFLDRADEWHWLIQHFKEPKQQTFCRKMRAARHSSNRIDHRSGKLTLSHRAYKISISSTHQAPFVAAYEKVYSHHPVGAENARKMNERVKEIAAEEGLEETDEPGIVLPLEKQLAIINEVVPQKRGTIISGVGDSLRRPPLPRGGATTSASLLQQIEETKKAREENAALKSQVSILEDRMRRLEDLMMRGSPEVGSSNAFESPAR